MIYVNDHPPPHFHAKAGEFEALVSIATGDVLEGLLPKAKLRKLQNWFRPRQEELAFVWTEIQARRYRGGLIG
jgi:hypothetical protein